MRSDSLNLVLLAICALVWIVCAINPLELGTWLIEQVATVLALCTLYWCRSRVHFGVSARLGMAILFCVHTIGTHFTYSLTPYDQAFTWLSGHSLNDALEWQRNHYDRFVHLMYGLCLLQPCKEAAQQIMGCSHKAATFVALNLILSTSVLYELIEWLAAVLFGGELGAAYLGMQGDIWDAQADMALAGLGALLAIGVVALLRRLSWPLLRWTPYG